MEVVETTTTVCEGEKNILAAKDSITADGTDCVRNDVKETEKSVDVSENAETDNNVETDANCVNSVLTDGEGEQETAEEKCTGDEDSTVVDTAAGNSVNDNNVMDEGEVSDQLTEVTENSSCKVVLDKDAVDCVSVSVTAGTPNTDEVKEEDKSEEKSLFEITLDEQFIAKVDLPLSSSNEIEDLDDNNDVEDEDDDEDEDVLTNEGTDGDNEADSRVEQYDEYSDDPESISEIDDQAHDVDDDEDMDDDDDDDVAVVLDSSDEERCKETTPKDVSEMDLDKSAESVENPDEFDEEIEEEEAEGDDDGEDGDDGDGDGDDDNEDDDDYDDNDLMNFVVMSINNQKKTDAKDSKKDAIRKIKTSTGGKVIKAKTKLQSKWDFRLNMKKRSVKMLTTKRMHHVDEISAAGIEIDNYNCSSSTHLKVSPRVQQSISLSSESAKDPISDLTPIEINGSAEELSKQSEHIFETEEIELSNAIVSETDIEIKIESDDEMQQLGKVRESIQKTDLKQVQQDTHQPQQNHQPNHHNHQQTVKKIADDQNKENVENNDNKSFFGSIHDKVVSKSSGLVIKEDTETKVPSKQMAPKPENIEISVESEGEKPIEIAVVKPSIENHPQDDHVPSIDVDADVDVNMDGSDDVKVIAKILAPIDDKMTRKEDEKSEQVVISESAEQEKSQDSEEARSLSASPTPSQVIESEKESTERTDQSDMNKSKTAGKKRLRSPSSSDSTEDVHPYKKYLIDWEEKLKQNNRVKVDFMDETFNKLNEKNLVEKCRKELYVEIQKLNSAIIAKEKEWDELLYMKRIKEDMYYRLMRKKNVKDILSFRAEDGAVQSSHLNNSVDNSVNGDTTIADLTMRPGSTDPKIIASTPNTSTISAFNLKSSLLNSLNNVPGVSDNNAVNCAPAGTMNPNNNVVSTSNCSAASTTATATVNAGSTMTSDANLITTGNSTAQSILKNRANMKSSDLAKEKASTQRMHRFLVSRNILPKPTSPTVAAVFGATLPNSSGAPPTSTAFSIAPTTSLTQNNNSGNLLTIPLTFSNAGGLGQLSSANLSNSQQQPILNSYLSSAGTTVHQQLGELFNGPNNSQMYQSNNNSNGSNSNPTLMVGRQGQIKDVKSIIADYRQRHPEVVPRRGRRVKTTASLSGLTQAEAHSILENALKSDAKLGNSDFNALFAKFDGNSRPSSNDSSHSMTNTTVGNNNNTTAAVSFKDALVQFVDRFTNIQNNNKMSSATGSGGSHTAPPPYPEVTLHPVSTSQSNSGDQLNKSLLHGILTKYPRSNNSGLPSSTTATNTAQNSNTSSYSSSFSPTLARLLTAPERITSTHNSQTSSMAGVNSYQTVAQAAAAAAAAASVSASANAAGLNLSKVVGGHNSEITITPVVSSQSFQQTLLQQQLHHQHQHQQQQKQQHNKAAMHAAVASLKDRFKTDCYMTLDDEADDSVDRLVIDEGGDSSIGVDDHHRIAPHAVGQEFHENEVPACQGCKKQEAQFVCAGCGNQWYCSRECQVAAWDEHSEVCTG